MANLVLYRKYRPKTFGEVVGQEHVVKTLRNAVSHGMISHAYLFSGPRGCGKTTMARLLAKAVNCEKPRTGLSAQAGEPCNECSACKEINLGSAMDLIEIDAASNRGIDEIRDLKEGVAFSPSKLKYKVFVIDECLTGDHLINMADGNVKKICEIKNGEKVFSIDIQTGKIVIKPVSNVFKRNTQKIIEIKTPQSLLRITPAHRLWIVRDSEFLLKEASELELGDFLLSPYYLPHIQKNNLTPSQLSFLALIQCDGHVSKDSITIQVETRKDKDYFKKVFEQGLKAWGIKEKPTIRETTRGTQLLRVYSGKMKDVLLSLSCPQGKKSTRIDIPNEVFRAPLRSIKAYLDTCFCCEGDIIPFKGHYGDQNYRLNFTSTSEVFAKKLQLLLKKFGIASNILEIKKRGHRKHSTPYRIALSGYNLRLFATKIGLRMSRKDGLLKKFLQKKEKQDGIPIEKLILRIRREKNIPYASLNSYGIYPALGQHLTRKTVVNFIKVSNSQELNRYLEFRYEKVKSIKLLTKKEDVYDFTVENTHTFLANGICSSNCHQLTKEATNALLKTLEEPPSHAIFILATTEIQRMIPTLASRCQRFDFRKLRVPEMVQRLAGMVKKEGIDMEKDALELLAHHAGGSLRDAEGLLDKVLTFHLGSGTKEGIQTATVRELLGIVDVQIIAAFADLLLAKNPGKAIEFLNKNLEDGMDPQEFAKTLVEYLRTLLILKVNPALEDMFAGPLTKEQQEKMKIQSSNIDEEVLSRSVKNFMDAEQKMKYSPIIQLPLELAIIDSTSTSSV